jgi:GDP-L-fucose synthase
MCGSVVKYINIIAGCSYPGYIEDGILSEDRYWEGPMHETVENYGITKRAQVLQGKYYKKQYGFNSIPLILINLYGPGEHFHPDRSHGLAALLRKFYEAKKYEQPEVVIWGSGKPIREWLYVEDAAQGVIRAADIYEDTEPLNIAVGKGYTITELANIIKDIVGYRGKLVYDKTKPDGALKKVADISKMKRILHWEPQASIEDGIKKLYQWLDSNYEEVIGLN